MKIYANNHTTMTAPQLALVTPNCLQPAAAEANSRPMTYADAVVQGICRTPSLPLPLPSPPPPQPQPQPPPRRDPGPLLGRPMVSLPFSQLTLGRSGPPWNAKGWHTHDSEMVDDPEHGAVLRVRYPKGSGTSRSRGPPGGAGFLATPRGFPATDVTLHYMVRFAPNFQWSRGGKLPGLAVGEGAASGGRHSARAASCRFVWQPEGGVVAYVYTPAGVEQPGAYCRQAERKGGRYGDHLFKQAHLRLRPDGQWNRLIMRIRLNGFEDDGRPRADGVLTVSVNGKAATFSGLVWRRFRDVRVSHVLFTTFYGGSWTCPTTTHADFSGFSVTT